MKSYACSITPWFISFIHVDRDDLSAKFWLGPVQLARNIGFSARELRKIEQMIVDHHEELQEKWNGYFIIER